MRLCNLDISIFELLARYRYLTPELTTLLLGRAKKGYVTERLRILLDHGYVIQYNASILPNTWPDFYMIDKPAINELIASGHDPLLILPIYRNEAGLKAPNFDHDFQACNVIASLEIVARQRGIEFITWQDIIQRNGPETSMLLPYRIAYRFPNGSRQTDDGFLKPDGPGPFGVRKPNGKVSFFALELESGNHPVEPTKDLKRGSTLKKVLAYQDAVKKNEHKKQIGIAGLRTLFVTKSETRVNSMVSTTESVVGPTNQFLFTHLPFDEPQAQLSLFDREWMRAGMDPTTLVPA